MSIAANDIMFPALCKLASNRVDKLSEHNIEKIKEGFSRRLQQVMLDKGLTSPKFPNKANTQKLADASGVTRQMAARYLNGDAIPEPTILTNIANWLMCDAWWLLYGSKEVNKEASNKISYEIFKFILNEMRGLIVKKASDPDDFDFLFENIINIYNNITEIEADLDSKKKSASIMINFIKHQYKLISSS